MPIAPRVAWLIQRTVNPLALRLAGRGSMVDLEHVGRLSGAVRHTPLMAFRRGETVTIALTHGPNVHWLQNVRTTGRCRLRMGGEILTLGAPRMLARADGLARVSQPQRALLRWPIRCGDFVELPIVSDGA
ncbi:nitroreductase/quinone reductase family protein [Pengzhenrongella sicca]|uniref:Nitroreductase family deazaflavin-dependent oxidoreductase n=1 Tax=Pengzhenrongella sicca TaxID=2819238 RepID=A0A8A4ZLD1_9MICO|nr:nitroreductase/quinone reductase family protein [Pengzhenrongella sicca]QTE30378.1 nitroreductase family deazaflavin-dependent oxidoreductase [Pengzhenrongella sicca]